MYALKGKLRHLASCESVRMFDDQYSLDSSGRCVALQSGKPVFCKPAQSQSEATALRHCASDRVVRLIDVFQTHFVLELLGQDLLEYLRGEEGPLLEIEVILIMSDILHALSAVHARGYIHGDVKPENFALIDQEILQGRVNLKLIDFDNSRKSEDISVADRATAAYLAPEAFLTGVLSDKTDMWAVGATAFLLLTDSPLVDTQLDDLAIAAITGNPVFPGSRLEELADLVSPNLLALLSAMLSRNPGERPSADEALARLSKLV